MAILEEYLIKVNVSHLSLQTRIDAAQWCFEKYGQDSVDFWSNTSTFNFKSAEQVNWFVLKWL